MIAQRATFEIVQKHMCTPTAPRLHPHLSRKQPQPSIGAGPPTSTFRGGWLLFITDGTETGSAGSTPTTADKTKRGCSPGGLRELRRRVQWREQARGGPRAEHGQIGSHHHRELSVGHRFL